MFNFLHLSGLRRLAKVNDSSRFWIGQVMVITSTILGVFLAANAGFKQAIEFNAIVAKRNTYHMLGAFEAELKDNILIINNLNKRLRQPNMNRTFMLRRHQTGKFIWTAMLKSKETFQLPPDVLTGVRRYYKNLEILRYELKNNLIDTDYFVEKIALEHNVLANVVLPGIKQEQHYLAKILTDLNISFNEIKLN